MDTPSSFHERFSNLRESNAQLRHDIRSKFDSISTLADIVRSEKNTGSINSPNKSQFRASHKLSSGTLSGITSNRVTNPNSSYVSATTVSSSYSFSKPLLSGSTSSAVTRRVQLAIENIQRRIQAKSTKPSDDKTNVESVSPVAPARSDEHVDTHPSADLSFSLDDTLDADELTTDRPNDVASHSLGRSSSSEQPFYAPVLSNNKSQSLDTTDAHVPSNSTAASPSDSLHSSHEQPQNTRQVGERTAPVPSALVISRSPVKESSPTTAQNEESSEWGSFAVLQSLRKQNKDLHPLNLRQQLLQRNSKKTPSSQSPSVVPIFRRTTEKQQGLNTSHSRDTQRTQSMYRSNYYPSPPSSTFGTQRRNPKDILDKWGGSSLSSSSSKTTRTEFRSGSQPSIAAIMMAVSDIQKTRLSGQSPAPELSSALSIEQASGQADLAKQIAQVAASPDVQTPARESVKKSQSPQTRNGEYFPSPKGDTLQELANIPSNSHTQVAAPSKTDDLAQAGHSSSLRVETQPHEHLAPVSSPATTDKVLPHVNGLPHEKTHRDDKRIAKCHGWLFKGRLVTKNECSFKRKYCALFVSQGTQKNRTSNCYIACYNSPEMFVQDDDAFSNQERIIGKGSKGGFLAATTVIDVSKLSLDIDGSHEHLAPTGITDPNYQFALVPSSKSKVSTSSTWIFFCDNKSNFLTWVDVLQSVTIPLEEKAKKMSTGSSNVADMNHGQQVDTNKKSQHNNDIHTQNHPQNSRIRPSQANTDRLRRKALEYLDAGQDEEAFYALQSAVGNPQDVECRYLLATLHIEGIESLFGPDEASHMRQAAHLLVEGAHLEALKPEDGDKCSSFLEAEDPRVCELARAGNLREAEQRLIDVWFGEP